jgi:uncharacterized protein (TIGR02266 family)
MVQEFLALNRRRVRGNPQLSLEEQRRWTDLRWQIEAAMCGSTARHRPPRRALRVPSNLKVECGDGANTELGSAQEIAEGGIFLATHRALDVGTPVHLRIMGDAGETVEVEGAVVWVRRPGMPGGPPGMGIEFANLDASQREAVAYLVEEALVALDPNRVG